MSATTVKLDGPILDEITRIKPRDQTLTAFVRETLEREVRQRKLHDAAVQYRKLLDESDVMREEAAEWYKAPLDKPARERAGK